MKLPPLHDDESFAYIPWWDQGEIAGIEMTLTKRHVSLVRIVSEEMAYASIVDQIRPMVVEMLIQLRVIVGDDA